MQNELKQISLRWISIFSDSESKYVKYNKQSDFLSSHLVNDIQYSQTAKTVFSHHNYSNRNGEAPSQVHTVLLKLDHWIMQSESFHWLGHHGI